ncbi:hypothetical protein VTI74DRAFT_8543 [Chaetomium olivicolor]
MEPHTMDGPGHPYYPQDSIIPGYASNSTPLLVILGAFGGIVGGFVLGSVALARWCSPALERAELLTTGWFVLCGFLHCFFEGYFVLNYDSIPASQSLFAQLWKEYALSDSRYLTKNPFMLCIESLTVITWGPLSLATAFLAARNRKTEQGIRHLLQAIVCVGHLYGVLLYYGTCGFTERIHGLQYSRPEALYYWGYYVGMNAPWVVVPAVLLWRSARGIQRVFKIVAEAEDGKKGR